MNSCAPERMALTITWGWDRLPIAKMGSSGTSWRRSSIARKAGCGLSLGMSTNTTAAFSPWIRRTSGSVATSGKLGDVCMVWATLVPSTKT